MADGTCADNDEDFRPGVSAGHMQAHKLERLVFLQPEAEQFPLFFRGQGGVFFHALPYTIKQEQAQTGNGALRVIMASSALSRQ
jgi:hypothetical protein